ncbi:MAG: DUF948 domain-containing protein [Coleofasciculaceae cyanobacterium]
MIDPLFWLGLSILLVAVSLTAVLIAALPALQELARAARSIEKLADTLRRELPPTLEAIRLTGLEISDLTDEVTEGVKSAGQVVKQVDQSISGAKNQAQKVQVNTRGVMAGVKAAWSTWNRPTTSGRRSVERLQPSPKTALDLSGDHSSIDDAYPQQANEAESSLTETSPQKIKEPSPKQYEDFEPEETSEY